MVKRMCDEEDDDISIFSTDDIDGNEYYHSNYMTSGKFYSMNELESKEDCPVYQYIDAEKMNKEEMQY